ncbi:MAG: hypothetical protein RIS20_1936 [Bacteroidota bacterium]|jgi:hypothetical protein
MKYFFLFGMLLSYVKLSACDLCGGVGSNASIGIFAANQFHLVGWRSQVRSFDSYLYGIKHSSETFWQNDLTFRTQLGRKVQVYCSIPFQVARQKTDFNATVTQGMGDPNVLFTYALIDRKDSLHITKDFLNIGLGVKMPFGKSGNYPVDLKNLYPGTGSWDGLFLANYTHRIGTRFSFQAEASHTLKGADQTAFRYGNSTQVSSVFIYNQKVKSSRFISSLGLQQDWFAASSYQGVQLTEKANNGYVGSAKASINLLTYNWLFSIQAQKSLFQQLSQGAMQQKFVLGLSVHYLIKKKQHEKNKH